ncbi:MAG: transglutaminase domain-containing protein [Bacteroidales bacterium]|nr:transglutaminase domain-containing protein [Candidatus Cryptobacteroides faecihippi]
MSRLIRNILILASLLVLSVSCEVRHFLTDGNYRAQVEDDLSSRLSGAEGLRQFYTVSPDGRSITSEGGYVKDTSLTVREREALEFLYAYMPLADVTDYPASFHLSNVRASFTAEEELGWNVPERVFRHFVLPMRVNNENLDSSRIVFYRELKPRVEGKDMKSAILEVNHWCHEKLTYHPSDARTLSPLSSVRSTLGRCGEEATFAVAALRAVGIPARQVYTPRWAHTDDNHAWVEAWADGEWYFLGACEPEPVLNLGWFNAPASRGMLMHTRVFGRYDGPEEKVLESSEYTEINLIDNYASTARVDFKVVDEKGAPVEGALVDFQIYNYAEFYPALSKFTDSEGMTFLTAGKGDMLAWASKDGLYGYSKVSFGKDSLVTVRISSEHDAALQSLMIVPPPENVRLPEVTLEQRQENAARFTHEDAVRKAYMSTFAEDDGTRRGEFLAKAAGNHGVIRSFLDAHQDDRAYSLLSSLSDKDLKDVTLEILEDSYQAEGSILCPRVENEFLSPYKAFFLSHRDAFPSVDAQSLVKWVRDSIAIREGSKPWRIPVSPEGVFKSRLADVRSRNIFFVALARTFGIDARKDPVTSKIQYREGQTWVDVHFDDALPAVAPQGRLVLRYTPSAILANPGYYSNFTISIIEGGRTYLLTFDEGQVDMGGGVSWESTFKDGTSMDAGEYVLVAGNRLSDGSVPVSMQHLTVEEGKTTVVDLVIRIPDGKLPVIGEFDSETRYSQTPGAEPVSVLSTTGRGTFVVGVLTPRHEPSVHAVNDLIAAKDELEAWGRTILLLTTEDGLEWLSGYSAQLPSNVRFGIAPEHLGDGHTMPYIVLADTFNRVFFRSEGYNIGLGDQIVSALNKL